MPLSRGRGIPVADYNLAMGVVVAGSLFFVVCSTRGRFFSVSLSFSFCPMTRERGSTVPYESRSGRFLSPEYSHCSRIKSRFATLRGVAWRGRYEKWPVTNLGL